MCRLIFIYNFRLYITAISHALKGCHAKLVDVSSLWDGVGTKCFVKVTLNCEVRFIDDRVVSFYLACRRCTKKKLSIDLYCTRLTANLGSETENFRLSLTEKYGYGKFSYWLCRTTAFCAVLIKKCSTMNNSFLDLFLRGKFIYQIWLVLSLSNSKEVA